MVEFEMAAMAFKAMDILLDIFSGSSDEMGEALGFAVGEALDKVVAALTNIGDDDWWEGLWDGYVKGFNKAVLGIGKEADSFLEIMTRKL